MSIYITGDTHGEQSRFCDKMLCPNGVLKSGDYLIVCGDFGYLFLNNTSENLFLNDLEKLPYTILFVDGNHECFPAIYDCPVVEWHGGKAHQIRYNIFHLMRGEIFDIDGKSFFCFGGAYSIDKYMLREGYSWFKEEQPTEEEYKNASENLKKHNFKVDYIVTHTMPREMILRFGKHPDAHDMQLTGFLEWIMYETEYKCWYCGHWHADKELTDKFRILWFDILKIA